MSKNTITPEIREEAIELCLIASNGRALDPNHDGVVFTGAEIGADLLAIDLAYEALPDDMTIDDAEWYLLAAERLMAGWTPPEGWR